jgi:E3 ubiquitin-protein ligase BRE1
LLQTEIASKTALLAAETARQQQSATEFSEAMVRRLLSLNYCKYYGVSLLLLDSQKKVAVADGEHASKLADVMRESERLAESLQQRLAEAEAKRRKQKQDEALQKSIDLPSMREMVADLNKRIASQSAELKTLRAELLQRAEAAVSSGERTAAEAAALAASPAAAALLQRAADDIRALTTSTSSLMAELTEICQSLDSTEAQADRATRLMSEKELANLSLMERNQRESNKTIMAQEQLKALQEEKRVARLASDARAELEKAVQAERARIDVFKKMADDELAALGALAAEARARIADADRARAAAQRQTSSVTADLEALKAANAQLVERERQLSKERAELHEAKVAAEAAKESAERKMQVQISLCVCVVVLCASTNKQKTSLKLIVFSTTQQTLRTALSGGGRGLKHYYDRLMCRVCKKQEISAVISLCYHAFCLDCLEQNVRDRSRKCPGCGLHFGQNDIKSIFF